MLVGHSSFDFVTALVTGAVFEGSSELLSNPHRKEMIKTGGREGRLFDLVSFVFSN